MAIEFLSGQHIYLRSLTENDVNGPYLTWFNDPEVSAANGHHYRPFTTDEALAYVHRVAFATEELVLAIATRDDDRHIGNVTLKRIDAIAKSAEFAIVIGDKTAWGKGYGKEIGRLVLDHAFKELNLRRVHCATYETTYAKRSQRILLCSRCSSITWGKTKIYNLTSRLVKSMLTFVVFLSWRF